MDEEHYSLRSVIYALLGTGIARVIPKRNAVGSVQKLHNKKST
jgi:hypothetical protein